MHKTEKLDGSAVSYVTQITHVFKTTGVSSVSSAGHGTLLRWRYVFNKAVAPLGFSRRTGWLGKQNHARIVPGGRRNYLSVRSTGKVSQSRYQSSEEREILEHHSYISN